MRLIQDHHHMTLYIHLKWSMMKDRHQIIHATVILCISRSRIEFTQMLLFFYFPLERKKSKNWRKKKKQWASLTPECRFSSALDQFETTQKEIWNNEKKVLPLHQRRYFFLTFFKLDFSGESVYVAAKCNFLKHK